MNKLTRTIHPEVRIVDAAKGIVDYIASDETIDSYKEIIRANGWRFTNFQKNATFVDSHDYSTIEKCLGNVIDFRVVGNQLIERVQWAIDVAENKLAQIGWKMTQAGYLKAVSVGFFPVEYVMPGQTGWEDQVKELNLPAGSKVYCIYTAQEQCELSACIIGANPNALAKMKILSQEEVDFLGNSTQRTPAQPAFDPGLADWASDQARRGFLRKLNRQ